MRSFMTALITGTLVFTLTSLAYAGPRIVTPRLVPPTDGVLRCNVSNASATKTLNVLITIFEFDGGVANGPTARTIVPNGSTALGTSVNSARHCVVEVTKGGKKNARVAAAIEDSGSNAIAAVNGK